MRSTCYHIDYARCAEVSTTTSSCSTRDPSSPLSASSYAHLRKLGSRPIGLRKGSSVGPAHKNQRCDLRICQRTEAGIVKCLLRLKAGQRTKTRLKLTPTARAALARLGRTTLTVKAVGTSASGKVVRLTRRATLSSSGCFPSPSAHPPTKGCNDFGCGLTVKRSEGER